MSQSVDVPHIRMQDEDEEQIDIREGSDNVDDQILDIQLDNELTSSGLGTPPSERHDGLAPLSLALGNSPRASVIVSPSVSALNRRNVTQKRVKVLTVLLSAVCLVGVSFAVARKMYSPPDSSESTTTAIAKNLEIDEESDSGRAGETGDSTSSLDAADWGFESSSSADEDGAPANFLQFHHHRDGASVFEISKALWNASFVVYPTVARHSAPQTEGLERGSVLLDTTEHVFHFEKPSDGSNSIALIQDYYYAELGEASEELRAIVEDSQWPGRVITVPIYMETDESFFIPSDPFLSNGFFVSSLLALAYDYTPVTGSAASYPRNAMFQVEYDTISGLVIVNYAVGVLPEQIMPQRVADDRVGYFSKQYTRYGMSEATKGRDGFHSYDASVQAIHRRRLEVDPTTGMVKEPITYYIDPSVPVRWRGAFVAGVDAWKPAFERIGFVGAIKAVLPGDADWPEDYRLGDLRYNSISVMISDLTYALGPSVIDPRSGEILHSDIIFEYGFFNQVMSAFDFFSPVDPPERPVQPPADNSEPAVTGPKSSGNAFKRDRAEASRFSLSPDTRRASKSSQCGLAHNSAHEVDRIKIAMLLAGQSASSEASYVPDAIVAQHFTDIVMHEVGHTLGLRHNFAASTAFTRTQLNDPAFVKKNGLTSSVMDYIPVNIFSDLTPEAADSHEFYMTVIGSYDFAAIAYGYSSVSDEVPGDKSPSLTALAERAPLFLSDEAAEFLLNPYAQRNDLSSDPVDFAADRLAFVEQARNTSWMTSKVPEDAPASVLWRRERALLMMVNSSVSMVSPMLGGANVTHAHLHAGQAPYKAPYVPRETQLRALDVISRVIAADGENGALFASPSDYAQFVGETGLEEDDCGTLTLDYSCLGRGLVNMDAEIMSIRQSAVVSALFPAIDRIVAQDAASPLSLEDLLLAVETAAMSADQAKSRNQALLAFFHDLLQTLVGTPGVDSRVKSVVTAMFPQISPAPVVRNKALLRSWIGDA